MSPHYRRHGKIQTPLTDEEWIELMNQGYFVEKEHRGFVALLYYSAVRKTEALRTLRNQIIMRGDRLYYSVGTRLKHGKNTPPLPIPLDAPFVDEIVWCWKNVDWDERIWKFCKKTAYNIVTRTMQGYPHYFRLSRITNFFLDGWTIAQVRSWTGLSLRALEYYVGLADISKMGDSLNKTNSV